MHWPAKEKLIRCSYYLITSRQVGGPFGLLHHYARAAFESLCCMGVLVPEGGIPGGLELGDEGDWVTWPSGAQAK